MLGLVPGAGEPGGLRLGRGLGSLRASAPAGRMAPAPGWARLSAMISLLPAQGSVQFAQAGRDVGPVVGGADRPGHSDGPVRHRQRPGYPL